MKKILLVAVLSLLSHWSMAADVWTRGYVFDTAANTGVDVWYGPGNKVTTNGAFARGANVLANANGLAIAESGSVLLRDGRAVAMTATRLATTGALAASAARLAAGPYGLVAALAIPPLYDWITAEGGNKIRVAPDRKTVEVSQLECVAPGCGYTSAFNGHTSPVMSTAAASQAWVVSDFVSYSYPKDWTINSQSENGACMSSAAGYTTYCFGTSKNGADSKHWYTSNLDDISPYMAARLPAPEYPKAIVDAGGDIDVSPVSVTGPSPALAPLPPYVRTTQYPAPADVTSTITTSGNPYGIPSNTPTVTGSSKGSTSLSPGSSSATGPVPANGLPTPGPINTPTSTVTTSTFDPTANQTTTTTTTKADPQTQSTTVTNVTNITNTTNTSTASTTSTVSNTTTNNTTNNVTTTTSTQAAPNSKPDTPVDPCDANPDRLGCLNSGTAPTSDPLTKKTTAVSITAVTFASSSACPAPLSFSVIGHSYGVSYQPLCDRLAMLKFLFLAMAGFVAAWSLASLFKV